MTSIDRTPRPSRFNLAMNKARLAKSKPSHSDSIPVFDRGRFWAHSSSDFEQPREDQDSWLTRDLNTFH